MAWMFVVNDADAARWVIQRKLMAFKDGVRIGRLSPGDDFILYVTAGALKGDSKVVAYGTIVTHPHDERVHVAGREFTKTCSLRIIAASHPLESGLSFRPLVDRLGFIPHKYAWSSALYRTVVELPPEDFELMRREFDQLK
jgi:hypothetical protein